MYTHRTAFRRSQPTIALGLALLLLLTAALATPAKALPPTPAVVDSSVNWQPPAAMISDGSDIAFPWTAVSDTDITHVIYGSVDTGRIVYTNNAGGSFNTGGVQLDVGNKDSFPRLPFAAIATGPNNVVHAVYLLFGKDNQIYYRRSDNGGQTWTTRIQLSGGAKSASPDLVVDAANTAHITWIEDRCGGSKYNVFYRAVSNGAPSGILTPRVDCSILQNRPQITVAGGRPQIVFDNAGEVFYRRLDTDGQWRGDNISLSPGISSSGPTIASDGATRLFVAWDEGINSHDILFRASFDGGATWSNTINYTNNPTVATAPYVAWSAAASRAYVVWYDDAGSTDAKGEIWMREFDPTTSDTSAAAQISKSPGRSFWPTIDAGPSRASLVWMDEVGQISGFFQVFALTGQIIGAGGCTGTLVLAGGAEQTKSGPVAGAITATCSDGGAPDTMQISIDAPPASPTSPAQVPFSANPSITMTDGGCVHTVFMRLFKKNTGGQVFSDNIKVDDTVNASLLVANPYMNGLPPLYTPVTSTVQAIAPADAYEGGASNGHPNYTRVRKFYLGISDNNDCTGLTDFFIPGSDTVEPQQIPNTGFAGSPALPGVGTSGKKDFTIVISDTIGNRLTSPVSLVYDPDRPTLGGGSVSGDTNTKTVLRTLTFSGVNVNDTLYGQNENLPAGQQFWGVWVANIHVTATPTITPGNPGLLWAPIAVPAPAAQFSIQWSLFSGLDYGTALDKTGNYQVLVRFLDGAGNSTQNMITTTLTLDPGYTMPLVYMPLLSR